MNCISVLQKIAAQALTAEGKPVAPVAWECNCLEEVCGACTMIINGRVRQACTALVDKLLADRPGEIELRPMTKFPVIRDLVVDRSRMFETMKKIEAWLPVDSYDDLGPGTRQSQEQQQMAYTLSKCMTCGCCLEACPQYLEDRIDAAARRERRRSSTAANGRSTTVPSWARSPSPWWTCSTPTPSAPMNAGRAARRLDRRRRHPGLRQRPELRAGLSQGDPPDHLDRPHGPRRHVAHAEEDLRPLSAFAVRRLVAAFPSQRRRLAAGRLGVFPDGRSKNRSAPFVLPFSRVFYDASDVEPHGLGQGLLDPPHLLKDLVSGLLVLDLAHTIHLTLVPFAPGSARTWASRRATNPGTSSATRPACRRPVRRPRARAR